MDVVVLYRGKLDADIAPYQGRYRDLLAKYRRLIWYNAFPRPETYVRELAATLAPSGAFVDVDADPAWAEKAAKADVVVLAYPDAIGLGYGPVERRIAATRKPWAAMRVINGNGRQFVLTPAVRASLLLRRLLARTLLGELLFTVAFVLVTPIFLLVDGIRGRR